MRNNLIIKSTAVANGVALYRVAEKIGMKPSNFSQMLRHELSEEKATAILQIIDELAAEGSHEHE